MGWRGAQLGRRRWWWKEKVETIPLNQWVVHLRAIKMAGPFSDEGSLAVTIITSPAGRVICSGIYKSERQKGTYEVNAIR